MNNEFGNKALDSLKQCQDAREGDAQAKFLSEALIYSLLFLGTELARVADAAEAYVSQR